MAGEPGNTDEKIGKSLLRQYLAPAGLGAIIGAIVALSTTLPKLFDYSKKISIQKKKLSLIESDIRAYSKVFQNYRNLLSNDELKRLFPDNAKDLYIYDKVSLDEDDRVSVHLKQSEEGAYFLWTEGSYNSSLAGARFGRWLTRSEAIIWAQNYMPLSDFKTLFDTEDIAYIDTTIKIDLY